MIDLFGLGKHKDTEEAAPEEDSPEPAAAPRGSHRLWAFLLVLDAVFVIVFAGALAAKIFQHWSAPAAPLVTAVRRRPIKEPPKAVEASTAAVAPVVVAPPPKAPEPPAASKPVAAAKSAATAKSSADAPRPPKPSMLVDAPRRRGMPQLADAAGKAAAPESESAPTPAPKAVAAPAAPGGKVKAMRAEFKIHAPKAKSVSLVGGFIVRGGRKEMARQEDGNWTIALYLNPGQYRYFFSVDKKKLLDPENPNTEKGASVMSVP